LRGINYAPLYRFTETGTVSHLAESYSKVDGDTWEVKLREDAKFHDGTPVTADDFKWTMEKILEFEGTHHRFVRGVESVDVIDTHTVHVHTENPGLVASWLYSFYFKP
jgi:peptide/nickel transport system substrate-binding protein